MFLETLLLQIENKVFAKNNFELRLESLKFKKHQQQAFQSMKELTKTNLISFFQTYDVRSIVEAYKFIKDGQILVDKNISDIT